MLVPSMELAWPPELVWELALGMEAAPAAAEPREWPLAAAAASVCDSASGAADAAGAAVAAEVGGATAASVAAGANVLARGNLGLRANNTTSA